MSGVALLELKSFVGVLALGCGTKFWGGTIRFGSIACSFVYLCLVVQFVQ